MSETQDTGARSGAAGRRRAHVGRWSSMVAVLIVAAACGGDGDSSDTAATSTVLLTAPTTIAAPATTVAAGDVATTVGETDGTTPSSETCPEYTDNQELPLRLCDSGTKVNELQQGLVDAGQEVVVDGFFGQQTHNAVLQYQAANNLEVDGLVGPLTWASLFPDEATEETTTTTG